MDVFSKGLPGKRIWCKSSFYFLFFTEKHIFFYCRWFDVVRDVSGWVFSAEINPSSSITIIQQSSIDGVLYNRVFFPSSSYKKFFSSLYSIFYWQSGKIAMAFSFSSSSASLIFPDGECAIAVKQIPSLPSLRRLKQGRLDWPDLKAECRETLSLREPAVVSCAEAPKQRRTRRE